MSSAVSRVGLTLMKPGEKLCRGEHCCRIWQNADTDHSLLQPTPLPWLDQLSRAVCALGLSFVEFN